MGRGVKIGKARRVSGNGDLRANLDLDTGRTLTNRKIEAVTMNRARQKLIWS